MDIDGTIIGPEPHMLLEYSNSNHWRDRKNDWKITKQNKGDTHGCNQRDDDVMMRAMHKINTTPTTPTTETATQAKRQENIIKHNQQQNTIRKHYHQNVNITRTPPVKFVYVGMFT